MEERRKVIAETTVNYIYKFGVKNKEFIFLSILDILDMYDRL